MRMIYLRPEDYVCRRWSGGVTAQIAIGPEGASYERRDFLWRVSSAVVELEESDFTDLPDYRRWISTVSGTMRLADENGECVTLAPYQIHGFDGGVPTHSWGKCTDFNLMLRKGRARGTIHTLRVAAGEAAALTLSMPAHTAFPCRTMVLFCGEGAAAVTAEASVLRLQKGEAAMVKDALSGTVYIRAIEDTVFLAAEIWS